MILYLYLHNIIGLDLLKLSFVSQLKKQGTLCRAVQTDCDASEYCTGESRDVSGSSVNNHVLQSLICTI